MPCMLYDKSNSCWVYPSMYWYSSVKQGGVYARKSGRAARALCAVLLDSQDRVIVIRSSILNEAEWKNCCLYLNHLQLLQQC